MQAERVHLCYVLLLQSAAVAAVNWTAITGVPSVRCCNRIHVTHRLRQQQLHNPHRYSCDSHHKHFDHLHHYR
ncbi:hypothetical protein PHSY_000831 [Pseudozyma hubeiensis SY62]|uniref:Secreted protein n=1 Tax=Pseudozyma hubeiensis (strain SY62) TaxID=1305764 RepID=R9NXI3_PSEHS|nr:hypothetical protein PHSY_000831 [Pseudozyma hubeiensis SY62]GAC93267.1 hypothetical protein PHSY_000831 [Pseudozyma hubeiensis SY62]